jgi:hypothetical protein
VAMNSARSVDELWGQATAIHDAKERQNFSMILSLKLTGTLTFRRLYELGNDPIAAIKVQEPTVN